MLLLEYPLTCLYIALGLLAFFLILFKLANKLEEMVGKSKPKEKKEDKKEPLKEKEVTKDSEQKSKVLEDLPGDDKNNYLYDRFVVNPTIEDNIKVKSISDTFITERDLKEIKEKKTYIRVSPVQKISCGCCVPDEEKSTLENVIKENKSSKSKLLKEFNSLSKEMKILLIENILDSID